MSILTAFLSSVVVSEGFSYNFRLPEVPSKGYAVSDLPDYEKVFDGVPTALDLAEYVIEHFDTLIAFDEWAQEFNHEQPNICLGGWMDSASGKYYLDVSTVVDSKEKALALAKSANQIAIWDFENCSEIRIDYAIPSNAVLGEN